MLLAASLSRLLQPGPDPLPRRRRRRHEFSDRLQHDLDLTSSHSSPPGAFAGGSVASTATGSECRQRDEMTIEIEEQLRGVTHVGHDGHNSVIADPPRPNLRLGAYASNARDGRIRVRGRAHLSAQAEFRPWGEGDGAYRAQKQVA